MPPTRSAAPLHHETPCPAAALVLALVATDAAATAALARLTPTLAAAARLRSRAPSL